MASCTTTNTTPPNEESFVDIHQFFESEVERLTEQSVGLYKRTRMDTTTASDSNAQPVWAKELYAFLDISIKPAVWKTDFTHVPYDEHEDINETAMVYKATNANQKVRLFKLKLNDDGQIQRFSAEITEKGKIATTITALSYTADVGYTLSVERSTKIMGNESYQIVGQFYQNK